MKRYTAEQIRNVGLFSHSGAGKTSLAEAALFVTGAIARLGRVEDGTTASDFEPEETKRHISINLSVLPCEWKGTKINLLDAPGYSDFIGEAKQAARVVDAAAIVVSAVDGVEVGTDVAWKLSAEHNLPRLIVVNKMDRENADFDRVVQQIQRRLPGKAVPIHLPIGAAHTFTGIVNLITMTARLGPGTDESPIPDEVKDEAEIAREAMVEAIAEVDDDLIAKYLDGEPLTEDEIRTGLHRATCSGQLVPILAAAALSNVGSAAFLDAILYNLPTPSERGSIRAMVGNEDRFEELPAAEDGPLAAFIFKTTADQYVGKLSYFRVYSGVLRGDSRVFNTNRGREERIGQVFVPHAKTQEQATEIPAGDIGAVAKLAETGTGDTLCQSDRPPILLPPISFPQPSYSASVEPKTKADLDKLGSALTRICDEDPTIHVHKEIDTNETILSGLGDSHLTVTVEKMKRKFGVEVMLGTPKVSYKETVTATTKTEYKHKKQTGGHGQYGHVLFEIEPLPRGSGISFETKVVGGTVPKNFIPAIEKGIQEAVSQGAVAGFPVVDVRVVLYDGSYHAVDSSEMAFKIAASQAFKKGIQSARPVLLEPVYLVRVIVPDEYTGDVMSDFNTKRARVQGMTPEDGTTTIEALVPLAEILQYSTDLRSMTQGRGSYTMEFDHYQEVPGHIAQAIVESRKKD